MKKVDLPNAKSNPNPNPNRSVENACDSHVLTRKEMTRRMGFRRVERLRWEVIMFLF